MVSFLILMVLRISFGMTTLPRSSMRRMVPVAFIYIYMGYDGDDDEGAIEFAVELAESGEHEAMKLLGMFDE